MVFISCCFRLRDRLDECHEFSLLCEFVLDVTVVMLRMR
jgi:hypothetical protein